MIFVSYSQAAERQHRCSLQSFVSMLTTVKTLFSLTFLNLYRVVIGFPDSSSNEFCFSLQVWKR